MPLIFRLVLNIKSLLDQKLLSIVNLASMVDLMLPGCTSAILILRSSLATSVHQSVHVLLCCGRLIQIVQHLFIRSRLLLALRLGVLDCLGGRSSMPPYRLLLRRHDHFT